MKREQSPFRAGEYEFLVAVSGRTEGYSDKSLYMIEGEPGLWRRVPKPEGDLPASVIEAQYGKSLVYLKYALTEVRELITGGWILDRTNAGASREIAEAMRLVINELESEKTEIAQEFQGTLHVQDDSTILGLVGDVKAGLQVFAQAAGISPETPAIHEEGSVSL